MVLSDSFFSKTKIETYIPEPEKQELFFLFDGFNKQESVDGTLTTVQLLYNLLFLEPGTYGTSPDMGIGIKNYYYQIMSGGELTALENKVKEQISLYIPNSKIKNIQVRKVTDKTRGVNNLGLFFQVGNVDTSKNFAMYFSYDRNEGRISTKIIV